MGAWSLGTDQPTNCAARLRCTRSRFWTPNRKRFYAGVPIHSPGGHAVGTLCVFDSAPRPVGGTDLTPLLDLAAMVDCVIAARVAASIDELTGVQNRSGFMKAGVPLLRLADRAGITMTVGFFDINELKQINDQLGHDAGDKAIASVARLLRSCFRSTDVIGRLGGDEFAVLFAATDETGAASAAARFQDALAAHAEPELPLRLTVAAGFITRPPGGTTLDELLAQADILMYENKSRSADKQQI